ncbi:MAG: Hpt domain-containing protein [Bdellovibrio sp.]|nr:Hpt domain-containing protein [Bdellovibrio sp.]
MTTTAITSDKYNNFESFEAKKLDVFIQLGKDLDEDVLSEMLYTYFQTTEETIQNFKAHFANKDFKSIAHLAHKLKSSSGQLGLQKLHQLCTDLENFVHSESSDNVELNVNKYLTLIFDETHLTTALLSNFLKAA